jgi:hypothetical protein
MESIGPIHALLARYSPDACVGVLAGGDVQERIRRAVHEAEGSRLTRSCPLHPVLVLWLVLCLPLYRATSIANVFVLLLSAWRNRLRGVPLRPVTDGALAHARERVGVAPVRRLFEDIAGDVEPEPSFHGRRVWALDGVHATVPDTPANDTAFGRPGACRGRSAFPQVLLVTLSSATTHEVRGARWSRATSAERVAALDLVPLLGSKDLVIMDRGFFALWFLDRVLQQGSDFLVRVPSDVRPLWEGRRGEGDSDVVLESRHLPPALRDQGTERPRFVLGARMIRYTLDGKETIQLLTTLGDRRITPLDLVRLYHERWEAELGYDEVKTHLSTVGHGTLHTVFRGRSPQMVEQELWATLALYNLVRRLIARAADLHRLDPRRISFTDALVVIRQAVPDVDRADLRALLPLYVRLMSDLGECRMSRWRRSRRAVRAVKVKMSNYWLKHPGDRCVEVDFLAGLRLLNVAA